MKRFESDHYIFHYGEETKAERDIQSIADCQENCFRFICDVLGITPEFRIEYYLCDSAEEVGRIYGDNDPCNGFASPPDTVYAVYNEHIQCIGFHEDAHLISYIINRPDCPAVREGLAMYFDRKWWGIPNMDWAGYYLKTDRFIPVDRLLDKESFFSQECSVTYPIMGPVTDDIGKMAEIRVCYVGFGQKDGMGLVHNDGKRPFYHAYPRGIKKVAQRA
ncbi:MAG: hypothetical protein K5629_07605 [Eubacteriales bacterium]|nr:hypothetical protein [Eubacteriales bacterium]